MLKLEAIQKDAQLTGLDPNGIVRVVSVEPVGTDAVTVYLKGADDTDSRNTFMDRLLICELPRAPAQGMD